MPFLDILNPEMYQKLPFSKSLSNSKKRMPLNFRAKILKRTLKQVVENEIG